MITKGYWKIEIIETSAITKHRAYTKKYVDVYGFPRYSDEQTVWVNDAHREQIVRCPYCGSRNLNGPTSYCPYCGAKLEVKE